jgi:hypothetical protein
MVMVLVLVLVFSIAGATTTATATTAAAPPAPFRTRPRRWNRFLYSRCNMLHVGPAMSTHLQAYPLAGR